MRRRALSLVVIIGGAIAWISIQPTVAAAGYDSTVESLIRTLSNRLIFLGVAVALIVEVVLLYVIVRYRNSGDARPTEYNPRFLTSYVLAVGLILFFVGFASFQTLVALDEQESNPPPEDAVHVDVVAEQWAWTFEYPGTNVTSHGTLVIPANRTVHLRITSRDVIHSVHVPELGLKQDANPNRWNNVTFTPTNAGEYRLFCAEYCGQGHSTMLGTVRVVNSSEYDRWLEEQSGNSTAIRTDESDDSRSVADSRRSSSPSLLGATVLARYPLIQ